MYYFVSTTHKENIKGEVNQFSIENKRRRSFKIAEINQTKSTKINMYFASLDSLHSKQNKKEKEEIKIKNDK